jgi:hypothetical protein
MQGQEAHISGEVAGVAVNADLVFGGGIRRCKPVCLVTAVVYAAEFDRV